MALATRSTTSRVPDGLKPRSPYAQCLATPAPAAAIFVNLSDTGWHRQPEYGGRPAPIGAAPRSTPTPPQEQARRKSPAGACSRLPQGGKYATPPVVPPAPAALKPTPRQAPTPTVQQPNQQPLPATPATEAPPNVPKSAAAEHHSANRRAIGTAGNPETSAASRAAEVHRRAAHVQRPASSWQPSEVQVRRDWWNPPPAGRLRVVVVPPRRSRRATRSATRKVKAVRAVVTRTSP